MDKIQRPAGVGNRLDQDWRSRRAPPARRQAFFAIEPVDAVHPGSFAVLPQ